MYKRILVPVDGSHFSEQILPFVGWLGRKTGTEVALLRAVDKADERAAVQGSLETLAGGVGGKAICAVGDDVTRTILDEAARVPGTLVAITSHGRSGVMRAAAEITKSPAPVRVIASPAEAGGAEAVDVIDLRNVDPAKFTRGQVSAHAGGAAHDFIKRSVELTLAGETHAVVTSALNKAALHAAGHHYDGHTELLAELCGRPKVTMMKPMHSTTHSKPYQNVRICQRKCDSSHVPATSPRFT